MGAEDRGGNQYVWIVTAAIVLLLLMMLSAGVLLVQSSARKTRAKTEVAALAAGVRAYRRDHGSVPSAGIGLRALLAKPYVSSLPPDPWGNPYVYAITPSGFYIYSLGPDGVDGTSDDVR